MNEPFPLHIREVMEEDQEKGTPYFSSDGVGQIVELDIGGAVKLEFEKEEKWYTLGQVLRVPEWGTADKQKI